MRSMRYILLWCIFFAAAESDGQNKSLWIEPGSGALDRSLQLAQPPSALAVSPDEAILAIGVERSIILYNIDKDFQELAIDLYWSARGKHIKIKKVGKIHGLEYSPDQTHIAAATDAGIFVVNASTGELVWFNEGHPTFSKKYPNKALSVRYLGNSGRVATISRRDGTLRIWSAADGSPDTTIATGLERPQKLAVSPDGAYLSVATAWDETVITYDAADMRELWRKKDVLVEGALSFAPDGAQLAVAYSDGGAEIQLFNSATGKVLKRLSPAGSDLIADITWTSDGHTLISSAGGIYGYPLIKWDLKRRKPKPAYVDKDYRANDDAADATVICYNGAFIAVAGKDNYVRLYRFSGNADQ